MINTPSNTDNKIQFNFTCYALKLLGHNLYSNPWTAVSEIVANGIDAKAECVCVLVDLFDKESAQIEIIDNGYGMSYQDLCQKYTIIGRNKRIDTPNDKSILGRKGVGKLAALFLSDKYYLYTKSQNETSSWVVDVSNSKDDDIPALERYDGEPNIASVDFWNNNKTGTVIRLTNVNLKKIGQERLKALPVILSDYYLSDIVKCEIKVCVRHRQDDPIVFVPVRKDISFSTMYSIFDNTGKGYKDRLIGGVYLTKENEMPAELDRRISTIKIDEFTGTSGTINVKNLADEDIEAEYSLTGWIGIHGSLDSEIQRRNNSSFNKVSYHPNAIRLYVRGKLAVDNLLTYITNTQAFANYIEGEICFDILDDDRFEDISTSNREGYKKDDIRVRKLLEVVGAIVQKLINDRVTIGTSLNKELRAYNEKIRLEAEQKRLEAERKAELERIAKEEEEQKRKEAERIADQERVEKERAQTEVRVVKKQAYFLQSQLTDDTKIRAYNTHVIKNNAGRINDNVLMLLTQHPECKDYKEVKNIALSGAKIATAVKYYNSVNYDLVNKRINGNITEFISQYIDSVIKHEFNFINVYVDAPIDCTINFPPQDFTVLIENVFSNAEKAGAKNLYVTFSKQGQEITIKFSNDGAKLPAGVDKRQLFEFGYSHSIHRRGIIGIGTGIGLYQIHQLVNNSMQGSVDIYDNDSMGVTLEVMLYEI